MRLLRLCAGALVAACSAAAATAATAKGDGSATPYEDASLLEIVDLVTEESRFQDILAGRQVLRGQPKACQDGVGGELLGRAIQRGFFSAVRNLIHACAESGVKLDRTLEETVNRLRREISDVANVLQHATREESVIAPAFEWAQSGNSVFLGVKFAHKLDAPACIDVVDQKVEILPSSIMLSATCKGKHKRFELKVDLLEPIDQEKSTWVMASVGRGTFTLVKSEPNLRWEKLLKGSEKPRNMHTWWQLHEKYENEIENLPSTSEPREPKKEKEPSSASSQTTGEKMQEENNEPEPNVQPETVEPSPGEEQEARLDKERAELKKIVKQLAKSISKETKKLIKESEGEFKSSLKVLDEKFKSEKAELEAKNTKTKKKFESDKADLLSKVNAALEESLKLVGSDSIQSLKASLATAIEKVREERTESTSDVAGAWLGLMDKVSSLFGTGTDPTSEKDEI